VGNCVPEGYVHIRTEDGGRYLVPDFMVPATHQALEAYRKKIEFDVLRADGGVSPPVPGHADAAADAAPRCRFRTHISFFSLVT